MSSWNAAGPSIPIKQEKSEMTTLSKTNEKQMVHAVFSYDLCNEPNLAAIFIYFDKLFLNNFRIQSFLHAAKDLTPNS